MYGVFISHKSEDWALAGRIYDYLNSAGYRPFLDVESLNQCDFEKELERVISQTPYFLLVLSSNTFINPKENWVIREIGYALKHNRRIFLVGPAGYKWPKDILPSELEPLYSQNIYSMNKNSFYDIMKKLVDVDIDQNSIADIVDWRQRAGYLSQTYMSSRETIQKTIGTLEARFGSELIECIKNKHPYTGKNRIKSIHMSCYAASLVFAPQINMVDERAFDRGILFDTFAELLKDDEFSLEIVITAPGCMAAKEAEENQKLGNGRLEEYPEAVFLSSFCSINRLIEQDEVFSKAYRERRFKFMVTDMVMPYAIFQMNYKSGYERDDHIKIDLYSEGITSNMDRRCMMIFRETDPENYVFFEGRYQFVRNVKRSKRLIDQHSQEWIDQWEQLKGVLNFED